MPEDAFNSEDEELAPIKGRNGNEVQDAKVQAQKGNKSQERNHAFLSHTACHLRHSNRACHIGSRLTGKNLTQAIDHALHDTAFRQYGITGTFRKTQGASFQGRHDPNQIAACFLIKLRNQSLFKSLLPALDNKRAFLAACFLDKGGYIRPGR